MKSLLTSQGLFIISNHVQTLRPDSFSTIIIIYFFAGPKKHPGPGEGKKWKEYETLCA